MPTSPNEQGSTSGVLLALGAFLIWGLSPIYFKSLQGVPALEILLHRMVWSFLLLLPIVLATRRWQEFRSVFFDIRKLLILTVTTILVSGNWFVFIWAVKNNRILEASLGYYINPLINVLLGMIFLKERLNRPQAVAVVLAAVGVAYLTLRIGTLPWVSLVLAFSFAFYGLIRKVAPVNALVGLTVETLLLSLPAAAYLIFIGAGGQGAFMHINWRMDLLLACAGLVTATPLLLFTAGARRINLATVGILQYSAPSCNFLLALWLYREPILPAQWVAFLLIWTALVIYSMDSVRSFQRQRSNRRRLHSDAGA